MRTAALAIIALLFSQLAWSAYACPLDAAAVQLLTTPAAQCHGAPGGVAADCHGMAPPVMSGDRVAPSMPQCHGTATDAAQPALCHQHVAAATWMLDAAHGAAVPPRAPVLVLVRPIADDGAMAALRPWARSTLSRPPPDPLFLSTLRLRV